MKINNPSAHVDDTRASIELTKLYKARANNNFACIQNNTINHVIQQSIYGNSFMNKN